MSLREQFTVLVSQTRESLLNQYEITDFLIASPEVIAYFKNTPSKSLSKTQAHYPQPDRQPDPSKPVPTPKPVLPPIQKPLPTPVRKPLPQVPPSAAPEPKKNIASPSKGFALEPLATVPKVDLKDIRTIYQNRFPKHPILDEIPDDAIAHQASSSISKGQDTVHVAILQFSSSPQTLLFLKNLARAISLRFGLVAQVIPAYQWEKEKRWDGLIKDHNTRLMIASDYGMQGLPGLMSYYREVGRLGQHLLGEKPLLLLSDLSHYMRQPHLKASLWQAVIAQLK